MEKGEEGWSHPVRHYPSSPFLLIQSLKVVFAFSAIILAGVAAAVPEALA
jgi:hypothetical protein